MSPFNIFFFNYFGISELENWELKFPELGNLLKGIPYMGPMATLRSQNKNTDFSMTLNSLIVSL